MFLEPTLLLNILYILMTNHLPPVCFPHVSLSIFLNSCKYQLLSNLWRGFLFPLLMMHNLHSYHNIVIYQYLICIYHIFTSQIVLYFWRRTPVLPSIHGRKFDAIFYNERGGVVGTNACFLWCNILYLILFTVSVFNHPEECCRMLTFYFHGYKFTYSFTRFLVFWVPHHSFSLIAGNVLFVSALGSV